MYYFIVNLFGGGGNARRIWKTIYTLLKEKNIRYRAFATKYEKHASVLADKISRLPDPDIRLVVVGGDGTINEVLNGIHDFHRIRFGVIPTGSANDFARGLNLPSKTEEALEQILSSDGSFRMDLGKVTYKTGGSEKEYLFGISSGVGMDAIVCKKVQESFQKKLLNKLHLGNIAYVLMTVQTLFFMEQYEVTITDAHVPEVNRHFSDLIFLAGMNCPAEGGGVPMAPTASICDGKLSFCAVNGLPKWKAFLMLLILMCGKHGGHTGVTLFDADSLTIRSKVPRVLHTDGEYLGDVTSVTMSILPEILTVL